MNIPAAVKLLRTATLLSLLVLSLWGMVPQTAQASIHVYRERPGQVTVRSRQSLRDFSDRAWQAIAFKRTQDDALLGLYVRIVGFPGAVEVDRQRPIALLAPTAGQQWQLAWKRDPQAKEFPINVGQYDLEPLLRDIDTPVPLELQVPLQNGEVAEMAIAPFIVREWLDVKASAASPAPVAPSLGE